MKAKYGILSIGCFIVFWLSVFALFFIPHGGCPAASPVMSIAFFPRVLSIFANPTSNPDNPLLIAIYSYYILWPFLGISLGFIGRIKKESPKWYSVIGLVLNLGLLLFLVLYVIQGQQCLLN